MLSTDASVCGDVRRSAVAVKCFPPHGLNGPVVVIDTLKIINIDPHCGQNAATVCARAYPFCGREKGAPVKHTGSNIGRSMAMQFALQAVCVFVLNFVITTPAVSRVVVLRKDYFFHFSDDERDATSLRRLSKGISFWAH